MKSNIFTYSVLRYIHSPVLGEALNVGMLFVFPNYNKVIFKSPEKFNRIKDLYYDFDDLQLKSYLRGFLKKSYEINKQANFWTNLIEVPVTDNIENVIQSEFIVNDSSALQFSEFKTGILYTNDFEKLSSDFYNLYFSFYEEERDKNIIKHDEQYVLKKYKSLLLGKNRDVAKFVKEDGFIVETDKTSLKFDLYWQNGTTNLIKPISFDLTNSDLINSKSVQYFGRLSLLKEVAEEKKYRFDLLLAKPQNRNLMDAYYKAVDVLSSCPAPKNIIKEADIEEYSEKTVKEVITDIN